ncbi:MAG TPA: hypothetical protein VJI13_04780 [Candidatus Norongarragalinales archaeon]|nr:hypothetical protein [Candidatus Norongarragalinales archaeon]
MESANAEEIVYHRMVASGIARLQLGRTSERPDFSKVRHELGILQRLGLEFLMAKAGEAKNKLSEPGVKGRTKLNLEREVFLATRAIEGIRPHIGQPRSRGPQRVRKKKSDAPPTKSRRVPAGDTPLLDEKRGLLEKWKLPIQIPDERLHHYRYDELERRLRFFSQAGVLRQVLAAHFDPSAWPDIREIPPRLKPPSIPPNLRQPAKKYGHPPPSIGRQYWEAYYELLRQKERYPHAMRMLELMHPRMHAVLSDYFNPLQPATIANIGRKIGIPRDRARREIWMALEWLGLPSAVSRANPAISTLVAAYGHAPPGLTPALRETHYRLRHRLEAGNDRLGYLSDIERGNLLQLVGIGSHPRTAEEIAYDGRHDPKAVYGRIRRALEKAGLEK